MFCKSFVKYLCKRKMCLRILLKKKEYLWSLLAERNVYFLPISRRRKVILPQIHKYFRSAGVISLASCIPMKRK